MKRNKEVLTTKIHRAKKWTKAPSEKAKTAKQIRMSILAANIGDAYYDEFSAQKQNVVDDIVFKSVETGVYIAHVDTIKKNVIKVGTGKHGIGATTVKETVRLLRLHASQEFYIGQIGNNNAGAYVFVDLRHPKSHIIMADLFNVMIAVPGVNNVEKVEQVTNAEQLDGEVDEQLDGFLQNAETIDTPHVEQSKKKSLSFISLASSYKDLKPKPEAAVNLYGKVCKLLNIVGKNALVTKLVRLAEKAKKNIINFTEDHFIYALQESVNHKANDLEAYTASIIYKTSSTRKENIVKHAVPVSFRKQGKSPESAENIVQAQIDALEQENKTFAQLHATNAPNTWFYPKKIERNNKRIANLKAELMDVRLVETPTVPPVRDFEAEKKAILEELGLSC